MTDSQAAMIAAAVYVAHRFASDPELPVPGYEEAAREIRTFARSLLSERIHPPEWERPGRFGPG